MGIGLDRGDGTSQDFRIAFDGVQLTLGRQHVFRGLTCGFQRGQILSVILGEAVLIASLGGVVGVLGAKVLFSFFDLSSVILTPFFYVPWYTALMGLGVAALIGLVSGIVPSWKAASLSVVDGLRRVA